MFNTAQWYIQVGLVNKLTREAYYFATTAITTAYHPSYESNAIIEWAENLCKEYNLNFNEVDIEIYEILAANEQN